MKSKKLFNASHVVAGEKVELIPFSEISISDFWNVYKKNRFWWNQFLRLDFKSKSALRRFVAHHNLVKDIGYCIVKRDNEKIIGFICGNEIAETEICRMRAIAKDSEGCGYSYEATQLFESVMKDVGYSAIVVFCSVDNKHSKKLSLRDGFSQIELGEDANPNLECFMKLI